MRIAAVGRKGGTGKSTVAVHLAAGLAADGPALLVDCDPQGSSLAWAALADDAGSPLSFPVVGLAVPNLHRQIDAIAAPYAHVILDTPPDHPEITLGALRAGLDVVVVPVQPTILDLAQLGATIELLIEAAAYTERPPAVLAVLSRIRPGTRSRLEARAQLEGQGLAVAAVEIRQLEGIGLAAGGPLGELGPFADLLAEVKAAAKGRSDHA